MDLATFIQQHRPRWRQLEDILKHVEGSGLASLNEEQAIEFGRLYRQAASDLNQAQTFVSGDATVQYLNDLVARCYLVIYARTRTDWRGLLRHLVFGFPATFRRHIGAVCLATAIFSLGTAFGFAAAYLEPSAREFLMPENFPTIEPGEEGEEENQRAATSGHLAAFSAYLFQNNMRVTLIAFALGITFGIGTAWLLWTNGLMTGALAVAFWNKNQFLAYCTGILPHGVIEIPAILIGSAAGFLLARSMIRVFPWPRLVELTRAGKEALLLVAGTLPLLIGAAFIEAVVARAPNRLLDSGFKLAVAGIVGLAFAAYVLLLGWKYKAPGTRV
jgi:uncharacterized membrane protein SpoIIM required for sporulation